VTQPSIAPTTPCAVLTIGTELTRGELVNSNAAFLSELLTEEGFEVLEHVTVDDNEARIVRALDRLAESVKLIAVTGGLGPTTDDLTTAAVARWMGVDLVRHEESLDQIRRRFERLGRPMSPSNAKQADFPAGATVLPNPVGTAPGFAAEHRGTHVFCMPGVPREMKRMAFEQMVPRIAGLAVRTLVQRKLRVFGLPESVVGEKMHGLEAAHEGVLLGYRAHFPEIEVKVLARGADRADARRRCERAIGDVRQRLGDAVFGEEDDAFAAVVGRAFRSRGLTLAVAESCTGGLIGALLTAEPGASEFFVADAVTYATSSKSRLLGVGEEVIRGHGVVSSEVAAAMAEGARRVTGADVGIGITGVAGPGGGTDELPVGTLFAAVASRRGTAVERRMFAGDRRQIQTIGAYMAMKMARDAALCFDAPER
jgi:nicotinamide-nucleotide amidase